MMEGWGRDQPRVCVYVHPGDWGKDGRRTANSSLSFISVLCSRCLYTCIPRNHTMLARAAPRLLLSLAIPTLQSRTCGLIKTRSINMTTKSCSTYLSQNRPQFLQTVRRMLWPPDLPPPPSRQSVLTGCRHSMQMGMASVFVCQ
jgi:hypothetical protein